MKFNNSYNKGFSLIEMLVAMIISSAVTMSLFMIFNSTQKKFFEDNIYEDIANYSNSALAHVCSILDSSSVRNIREIAIFSNNGKQIASYEISFDDNNRYNISFNRSRLIIKDGNTDITPPSLSMGYNNFGTGIDDIDPNDLSLTTQYDFSLFKIEPLEARDLYQKNLNPRKLNALKKSSFEVCLDVLIENELPGYSSQNESIWKTKTYCERVFNKTLYLREISRNNPEIQGNLSQF